MIKTFVLFSILFFSSSFFGAAWGLPAEEFSSQAVSLEMVWTLIASFLIFFMLAGFTLTELGLIRAKNAGSVILKNFASFVLGAFAFLTIGYGFMFGESAGGFLGTSDFFLSALNSAGTLTNWKFADVLFQVLFAATAATIASGALSERTRLRGYLFYSGLISAFMYPLAAHWVWQGGWLARLGAIDFAGASVVHSLAGWVSLAAVLVLGPRLGRFNRDGSSGGIAGHDFPMAALGVCLLWFGWFGYSTGNTLLSPNSGIALVTLNTFLAGAGGAMATMILTKIRRGRPEAEMIIKGIVSGLVSSTGGAAVISPLSAALVGGISGVVLYGSLHFCDRLKIDDPVGAISIHGFNGVWGTLAVGLFAQDGYGEMNLGYAVSGLFLGGGLELLAAQALMAGAVFLWVFPLSYGFFRIIQVFLGFRVSPGQEGRGLDQEEYSLASYAMFADFQQRQEEILEELQRVRELSLLREIGQSMHTLNLDEILELILQGVVRGIGFDRARLYLLDEEKRQLICRLAVGLEKDSLPTLSLPYDKEDNIISRAISEGNPFIVEDAVRDPRVNRDLIGFLGVKSLAAAPLLSRKKVLGGIAADNLISETRITERKLQSLMIFANQAALALENALMYEELKSFNEQLGERVKTAAAELEATQKQLFQAEKLAALGKLSAGIAHEIRNPLTSIKILIHSLADPGASETSREKDLNVIESEIERVNKIIRQFLDFARPRPPSLEPVDARNLIEETLALVGYEIESQGVQLEREDESDLPPVAMDREQMKQVLLNLILNALQALPQGGKIRIQTSLQASGKGGKENRAVEIRVQDTGEGIPAEIQSKIFEPFFSTKEEGIGLGLSVAQRIVDEHGGKIRVESAEGAGTLFSITLPLK
ncbi:MAG: ammonium transporter [Deltaproteobacteria bacterium]|nr:ammonium transporter [Deltaproteobacteria bacterium]